MEQIFDRETLLDLLVNIIPLAIILFFVGAFLLFDPFAGLSGLGRVLQFGLLIVPFLALVVLTYLSAKAIAGAERNATVYLPGQAPVEGAQPVEEADDKGAMAGSGPDPALDSSEADGDEPAPSAGSEPPVDGAETAETTDEGEAPTGEDEEVSADEADAN